MSQFYLVSFNQLWILSCSSVQVVGFSILVACTYLEPSGLVIICLVYILFILNYCKTSRLRPVLQQLEYLMMKYMIYIFPNMALGLVLQTLHYTLDHDHI